jgi:hypothetical protein
MSGGSSDKWQIVRRQAADRPRIIRRPDFSPTEMNSSFAYQLQLKSKPKSIISVALE